MWHGPELVGWLLVALCGGAGGYCLGWAARGPGPGRQAAAAEGAMGLGMAAMAAPVPDAVAHGGPAGGAFPGTVAAAFFAAFFVAFFAAVAAWMAVLPGPRGMRRLHHVAEALAMVYASVAMTVAAAGGHGPAGLPALTALLLGYLTVAVLLDTAPRLVPAGGAAPAAGRRVGRPGAGRAPRAPEVVAACRLALGLGTVAMLVTL